MVEQASWATRLFSSWLMPARHRNVQNQEQTVSNAPVDAHDKLDLTQKAKEINASNPASVQNNPEEKGWFSTLLDQAKGMSLNMLHSVLHSFIKEGRAQIQENKEIIRQVDERLENSNLTDTERVKLSEVKENAQAKIDTWIDAIKVAKDLKEMVKIEEKVIANKKQISDKKLAEFFKADKARGEELGKTATPADVEFIVARSRNLHEIVGAIKNEGLRASLSVELAAHDNFMAEQIANNILPPENASEANYTAAIKFVDMLSTLSASSIISEMTQAILDRITENIKNNEKADEVAYDKKMEKNKEQAVQDLRVAINKFQAKLQTLKQFESRFNQAVSIKDKQKALAYLIEQLNKPPRIV